MMERMNGGRANKNEEVTFSFDEALKRFEEVKAQPNMKPEDTARVDAAIADLLAKKAEQEKSNATERGQA